MKDHKKPQTWMDSLDKRPKRKKMDIRFGTWNVRSYVQGRFAQGSGRRKLKI
jgi:hypothetical protein